MAKNGRPSLFTQAIAEEICERLANDESLSSICAEEKMPATTTVYRWRDENEDFRANYARARTDQGHTVADTVGDIRKKVLTGELDPNVARVAADLAKWEAGKRASKDFGDKIDVTSGGEKLPVDDVTRATRLASILAGIEKRNADD